MMMLFTIAPVFGAETNTNDIMHISVNTTKLAQALNANNDQAEAIHYTMNMLDIATQSIAYEKEGEARRKMLENAVKDNVRLMRGVLNDKQFKRYLTLLNVTLVNRGLR